MKASQYNILNSLKYGAFALVLFSLLLQPLSQVISILNNNDIELVSIDWEEDSLDEEDKQEDDSKEDEEKTEPQYLNNQRQILIYVSTTSNYDILESVLDFNLEILIPPPKFV
jgi:hypothetical protein